MVDIYNYTTEDNDSTYLSLSDAERYATEVATEALNAYIIQTGNAVMQPKNKGVQMNTTGIETAVQDVLAETKTSAGLISGEVLLENIEVMADKLVLSRMSWWKRFLTSKSDKEIAVTIATYVIVHGIKTGGFGLTKYKINHIALDYVTLAANQRIMKYIMKSTGVDFNIAKALFSAPTISVEG